MPGDAPPLDAPGFVLPEFLEPAHEDQRGHVTVRAAPVRLQLGVLADAGDYVVHGELQYRNLISFSPPFKGLFFHSRKNS